jgi:hypothetical protein
MSEPLRDQPNRGADEPEHVDDPGPGFPPPSAVESLVNALLESGPEVAEHVVNAARELLLAAQTIVDAAEHAVQEQQELRRSSDQVGDQVGDEVGDEVGAEAADDDAEGARASVHHLDVAE